MWNALRVLTVLATLTSVTIPPGLACVTPLPPVPVTPTPALLVSVLATAMLLVMAPHPTVTAVMDVLSALVMLIVLAQPTNASTLVCADVVTTIPAVMVKHVPMGLALVVRLTLIAVPMNCATWSQSPNLAAMPHTTTPVTSVRPMPTAPQEGCALQAPLPWLLAMFALAASTTPTVLQTSALPTNAGTVFMMTTALPPESSATPTTVLNASTTTTAPVITCVSWAYATDVPLMPTAWPTLPTLYAMPPWNVSVLIPTRSTDLLV